MSEVKLGNIAKSFGAVEVIPNLDLDIRSGEFVVFVGPSGCGKSTLLRIIAGLETQSGGSIFINNKDVTKLEPVERHIAMVFQSYALYPHMTVAQNMEFGLEMAGIPKKSRMKEVQKAAKILQIDDLLSRKPKELSGGQRQRVAIGRAIVRNPQVFLFDEPLSNLDAELRVQMRLEIAKLHRNLNATMIYVTHDQTEAMTLADKIVVLKFGIIEQYGKPTDLYNNPDTVFVAGFLGSPKMNFVDAEFMGTSSQGKAVVNIPSLSIKNLHVPIRGNINIISGKITLGIRPEHFGDKGRYDQQIALSVDVLENLGGTAFIYSNTSTDNIVISQVPSRKIPAIGETINLTLNGDDCLLFDEDGLRI